MNQLDEPTALRAGRIEPVAGASAYPVRASAALLLVAAVLGALVGVLVSGVGPRFTASATVLLTGQGLPDANLYVVGRYVLDRAPTGARIAASDLVADAAATQLREPAGALHGTISATANPATSYLDIEVEAPDPAQAVRRAGVVGAVAAEVIATREDPGDRGGPRIVASVIGVEQVARDERFLTGRLYGVLGAVLGLLGGWTLLAMRRPGRWTGPPALPLHRAAQAAELRQVDRLASKEAVDALLLGRSAWGLALAFAGAAGILGYALTSSPFPPLLVVLGAGYLGRRDLRYSAGGIIYAGVTSFPAKVNIVDVGLLTPTVLEVAVVIGVVQLVCRKSWRWRGPFTGPVLGLVGAMIVGAVVGRVQGATLSEVFGPVRLMATIVSFFVIREAFRDRPYQLVAITVCMSAMTAAIQVLAVPLNLEVLLSSGGSGSDKVVIGETVAELARLDPPVLQLMSILIVIVAAGVFRLRPVWLWALVLSSWLVLEAVSFTRMAWGVLAVLTVAVAGLRGGLSAFVVRGVAVLVIGSVSVGLMQVGMFGTEGTLVAARIETIVSGEALESDSLADRLRENAAAERTLEDSPIVGTGMEVPYGAVLVTFDSNRGVQEVTPRLHIHNQYLRIWLWMGVLGLLAYGWLGVRVVAFAHHERRQRGRAATTVVACAVAIAGLAVQLVLAPDLDNPATLISIAIALAVMETAAASGRADRLPGDERATSIHSREHDLMEPPMRVTTHG